jgi:hypothetical protein
MLVLLALFLLWEVVTRSFAAYLADVSPAAALRLRSTEPMALLNLADGGLNRDISAKRAQSVVDSDGKESEPIAKNGEPISAPSDPQGSLTVVAKTQAKYQAELALFNDPLNAHAFGILGRLALLAADEGRTEIMMQAASRRSLLESDAILWMMQQSYRTQNYNEAIRYADVLLRTRPGGGAVPYVMPVLAKIAEDPEASGELKRTLAANPPWREKFFSELNDKVSDGRTPLGLLLSLKGTAAPPSNDELRAYLNFLIGRKFFEPAYYTWLQFLPPEQLRHAGNLFNGGFEFDPSGLPFDWVLTSTAGVTIKIAPRRDQQEGHALFMKFGPGRVDPPSVTQLTILAPGGYRLKGKYQVDIDSQRGLQWRISCANDQGTLLGEGEPLKGSQSVWTDFEFSFTVPETNCPAQYVRLLFDARWESEEFISGSIWFDDLQILSEPAVAVTP